MDELEIKQRMANLDKAYAEIEKMRAESQRLLKAKAVAAFSSPKKFGST